MNIHAPYISPELEQAAASTRTEESARAEITATRAEAEARVLRVRGSYDAPGFEACVSAEVAEITATRAQSAFLSIVERASEMTTERMLFLAKSAADDLGQRDNIGQAQHDEMLIAECKRLTKGDELKARWLASAVLFT